MERSGSLSSLSDQQQQPGNCNNYSSTSTGNFIKIVGNTILYGYYFKKILFVILIFLTQVQANSNLIPLPPHHPAAAAVGR
jgi:hypothetical protein